MRDEIFNLNSNTDIVVSNQICISVKKNKINCRKFEICVRLLRFSLIQREDLGSHPFKTSS